MTVRAVAARHDAYPSLLRIWRRQVREGHLSASSPACFMPVRTPDLAPPAALVVSEQRAADAIEIVIAR